jgi:AcrR family transcriptional regulator
LRGEILDAAKKLLAETADAGAVSIRAVADIVGVTPPSIYLHFADKDALIEAVVADVFTELDEVMTAASAGVAHPLERVCQQGMAYVRFALESPEHYRLATMATHNQIGDVDQVLRTSAFAHFAESITACMDAGIFAVGDPTPVVLRLWSSAHGIASLLIAKPYVPWGDPMDAAYDVMGATAQGLAIWDYLGRGTTPTQFAEWLTSLPPRAAER